MVDDTVVEEFRFSRSTRSNHFQHGLHSRRIDSRNGVEVFGDKLVMHLRRAAPLAHILFQNFERLWFPGLQRSDAFDVSGNNADSEEIHREWNSEFGGIDQQFSLGSRRLGGDAAFRLPGAKTQIGFDDAAKLPQYGFPFEVELAQDKPRNEFAGGAEPGNRQRFAL